MSLQEPEDVKETSQDSSVDLPPDRMLSEVKLEDSGPSLHNLFDGSDSDEKEMNTQSPKTEDLGGDVALKADEDGQPILARTAKVKSVKHEPLLYPADVYPSARPEAALAFQELEYCTYQSRDIGETGQEEMMSCDCKADIGSDGENFACGEDSNCINRLTSIECTDDECNCGTRCANQRFQLREYAGVDVFHAGQKGYGLRALVDLTKDMFVYEYIGEVIGERKFRQRQKEYEEQGEKHFYFMMLQKGEYIDATKKGGFGRFINHSCEPNCYVDKWVVGSKLRMGIFTKRSVVKGEELTFDYNVDRYGGEATPCYCQEPTCLGYIGGKTQTEAANKLPQNLVEALGIDDEDDWDEAKPKARRRKKGQDDEEYVNDLTPRAIKEKDVPKIMSALLQNSERWVLKKLLVRISDDANEKIQTQIVALHGYQALGSKLEKWKEDAEISILILRILQKWPTLTKNKISSSKIETHVKALVDGEDTSPEVKELSTVLLETWSNLEMAYRIPRRVKTIRSETTDDTKEEVLLREEDTGRSTPNKSQENVKRRDSSRGPRNPTYRLDQPWRRQESAYRARDGSRPYSSSSTPQASRHSNNTPQPVKPQISTPVKIDPINHDLQAIIDAATKKQQEQAAALKAQEEQKALEESARLKAEAQKRAERASRHEAHKAEKEKRAAEKKSSHNEKRKSSSSVKSTKIGSLPVVSAPVKESADDERLLERLFARFVPNVTAKYQEQLGKDQFKKRAKELVKILVAKEMKKEKRETSELSETKKSKVKAFARDFMEKIVARQSSSVPDTPEVSGASVGKDSPQNETSETMVAAPMVDDSHENNEQSEDAVVRSNGTNTNADAVSPEPAGIISHDDQTGDLASATLKRALNGAYLQENEAHPSKRVK